MPGNIVNLTPADIIAQWPEPNYEDPKRKTWLPAYAVVLWAVGSLAVAIRFWLRFKGQAGRLGLDDALFFPAWLFGTMFTAITILYATWGSGDIVNIWDVRPAKWEDVAYSLWLGEIAFLLCAGFCKVSVLLFYRRLVKGTYSRRWKYAVFAAIGFTIVYTIAFIIVLCVNCTPTEAYWKAFNTQYAMHAQYTCMETKPISALAGGFAALSDLYAVALPCAITHRILFRQKMALNAIFSLGLLVVGASCARTYYLIETGLTPNLTRPIFNAFVWSTLELQLGISCSSAPSLQVLFRKHLSGTLGKALDAARHATTLSHTESGGITVTRHTSVTSNALPQYKSGLESGDISKQPLNIIEEYDGDDGFHSPATSGRSDERPNSLSHEHELDDFPLRNAEARGRT